MNATLKVSELFDDTSPPVSDLTVSSVEYDSRKVKKGSCFVALKGFKADGHEFVNDAVRKGASLVVVERDIALEKENMPVIQVKDTRSELARLSDSFYGHPSSRLGVIGITGTNGKTTISYLLQKILDRAGFKTSRFGTIDYQLPDETVLAPITTPESADLQKLFAKAALYKNPRCVMEVSSHGIAQGRLLYTSFKGGVFTNLTQDHLDFHGTMDEYRIVKKRFFTEFSLEYSVINCDDPTGSGWIRDGLPQKVISYGFSGNADIRVLKLLVSWDGARIRLSTPAGEVDVNTPLPGMHNVFNVMAAVGVGIAEGLNIQNVAEEIATVKPIPGRFEKVEVGQNFAVVVDYAHTDNALLNLLKTARELTRGRVICLFGCGGDRDRSKRKLMGRVADDMADIVVVTSDNPRTEDPGKIIEDILEGMRERNPKRLHVIESRKDAIEHVIKLAKQGDCVLLAGKGHEDYQIIGNRKHDFDDRKIAAEFLREIG